MTLSREAVEGLTITGTICMVHLAVILFCSLVNLALITKLNVHLMYTNTTYTHVYYKQCALNIALFAKLKCPLICQTYYLPNII